MSRHSSATRRPRLAADKAKSLQMLEARLRTLPSSLIADALQCEGLVIDAVSEQRIRAHVPATGGAVRRWIRDWMRAGEIVVERRPSRLYTTAVLDYGRTASVAVAIGFLVATLFAGSLTVWLAQGILLSGVATVLVYVWSRTTVPSPVLRALGALMEDELAGLHRRAHSAPASLAS